MSATYWLLWAVLTAANVGLLAWGWSLHRKPATPVVSEIGDRIVFAAMGKPTVLALASCSMDMHGSVTAEFDNLDRRMEVSS